MNAVRLQATVILLAMVPLGLAAVGSYGKPQKPPAPAPTVIEPPADPPAMSRAVKTDSFRAPQPAITTAFKTDVAPFKGARIETFTPPVLVERPAVKEEVRPPPLPLAGPPPPPQVKKKTRLAYRSDDICTRHGMHRVDYGRRWRCRR
jgi:hypothetical protein